MTEAPQILLSHQLKKLKLPTILREYDKQARLCAAEGRDHVQFLARLVELELIDRERRMIERRVKAARFPATKSLDSFDFTAIPSLNKMQVLELARCEWPYGDASIACRLADRPLRERHRPRSRLWIGVQN
jgi:DNA replication protein DnaC